MTRPSDIPQHIYEWAEIFCDEHRHIEGVRELVARAYMLAGQGAGRQAVTARAGLTPSQIKMLAFIGDYVEQHGFSPSFSEIAKGMGLKSKGPIHDKIQRLAERGHVTFKPGLSRSITIVGRA